MTLKLKILAYRSLLGMYAASIIEEYTNEAIKKEWWYQNAYKVYKNQKVKEIVDKILVIEKELR